MILLLCLAGCSRIDLKNKVARKNYKAYEYVYICVSYSVRSSKKVAQNTHVYIIPNRHKNRQLIKGISDEPINGKT